MVSVEYIEWDPEPLNYAARHATVRFLEKSGQLIQQRVRDSMREMRESAPPGRPPNVHVGRIRDNLYYAVERDGWTVVIGPTIYGDGGDEIIQLTEYGGVTHRLLKGRNGRVRRRTMNYRPHPFMGPAVQRTGNIVLPDLWANSFIDG